MQYQVFRIKDICSIKSGKRLPKGDDFSSGITDYAYIRARDIKNGRINSDDFVYITKETQSKIKKYIVNEGDIIITIVGASVGDTAYVSSEFEGVNLTENAVRLTMFNGNIVNSAYLSYYIGQSFMKRHMEILASGAAQPKLGIYKIEGIKVLLPKVEIQHRIASILSTYDALIENNSARIRVLEEMAENLYKEWFVRFRFPGHENVEMENGLPKGWKVQHYSDVSDISAGGDRPKKYSKSPTGMCSIPIYSNGIEDDGLYGYTDIAKVFAPCITISARGTVGFVALRRIPFVPIVRLLSVVPHKSVNEFYLYFASKANNLEGNGTSQQQLTVPMLKKRKIIIPTKGILTMFHEQASLIYKEIDNLQKQNSLLARQRDLLLPRLMSGKLEVKDIQTIKNNNE